MFVFLFLLLFVFDFVFPSHNFVNLQFKKKLLMNDRTIKQYFEKRIIFNVDKLKFLQPQRFGFAQRTPW